ncbi:MAG: gamma-glutamyl-gamma-aminobutyrate hydrolase family protein [Chloroflexota bacterium]
MPQRPLIGITPTPSTDTLGHGTFHRYVIADGYTDGVNQAGGIPVVIPPQSSDNIAEILDRVDGLLFSGGGDLNPALYNDDITHEKTAGIHEGRDSLELGLITEALERDMPILCICRGIQVLNVALGGTLHQHVPDLENAIQHRQQEDGIAKEEPGHSVMVEPDSLLAATYRSQFIEVNSFHHQGLKTLGVGLRVNARASDGLVEAVDLPGHRWVLGVQWHPEMMFKIHAEHHRPFAALIEAARSSVSALA